MSTPSWMHDFIKLHGFRFFKGQASKSPLSLDVGAAARFIRISLQEHVSLNLEKIVILDENSDKIFDGVSVLVSSSYGDLESFSGDRLLDDSPSGLGFHSKNESSPWVVIDLGKTKKISKLAIYNRGDKYYTRALTILVEISENLTDWETIHNNVLYRKQKEYLSLSDEDKILCDLAALQSSEAISYRNTLVNSERKSEAISFLKKANHVLEPYNLALGPHGLTQTFSIQTKKQLETVYHELSTFLSVLNDELGIPAFASSGTLLGLVRNGEFLGHDDDIDVCYIGHETTETGILAERTKITEALKDRGYGVKHATGAAHLWVSTPAGIGLDLFTGWQKDGRCIMNPLSNSGVDASEILPLKKISSHLFDLYIPKNPTPLMVLNYGVDWETPDTMWKFDWSHARKQYNFLYL